MFDFFKKRKRKVFEFDEEAIRKSQEEFVRKNDYRMEHDPEFRKSVEESRAFFEANREARKAAGLEDKPGEYTFTCPNCGSECKGSWHSMFGANNLHGRTDCFTCGIHLVV